MAKSFAGVDVSQDKLDVHVLPAAAPATFPNTDGGISALAEFLRGHAADGLRVVFESTGGMELPAALACEAAGFETAIVRPERVKSFAKAEVRHAKTDALDAALIARFASKMEIDIHPLPPEEIRDFRDLLDRRGQLVAMRTMEHNRLKSTRQADALESVREHIRWIDRELAKLDKEMAGRVAANPAWKRLDEVIQSVPGYGPQSSHALIGQLPELGKVEGKRLSHLVGVAPLAKDSGNASLRRHIVGGRMHLRNTLYMAAVAAVRCNPVAKAFHARLKRQGKASKVALIAVVRKLLCILNAMVKADSMWRDSKPAT